MRIRDLTSTGFAANLRIYSEPDSPGPDGPRVWAECIINTVSPAHGAVRHQLRDVPLYHFRVYQKGVEAPLVSFTHKPAEAFVPVALSDAQATELVREAIAHV